MKKIKFFMAMIACVLCATMFTACESNIEDAPKKKYKEVAAKLTAEFSKGYEDFFDIEVTYTNLETGQVETKNTSTTYKASVPYAEAPKDMKVRIAMTLKPNYKQILEEKIANGEKTLDFIFNTHASYAKIDTYGGESTLIAGSQQHHSSGMAIDSVLRFLEMHTTTDELVVGNASIN